MPPPTLLKAELRAGRKSALRRVRAALETSGDIPSAAHALGISPSTLRDWVSWASPKSIPAVCQMVDELGMRGRGRFIRSRAGHRADGSVK